MSGADWPTEDSCRKAVEGKFREEPIVKGLKKGFFNLRLIQLDSVSNEIPKPTLAVVGLTKVYPRGPTYQMSK